ncbi:hypothetical protein NFJ02_29g68320 [Pycnococcus provasolii]
MCIALHGAGVFPYMSFDVGNAYANTPQTRVVYIRQPPGYDDGTGDVFELIERYMGNPTPAGNFGCIWSPCSETLDMRMAADPCLFFKGNFPAGTISALTSTTSAYSHSAPPMWRRRIVVACCFESSAAGR